MQVIIRAWNAAGYHKDLVLASEKQIHMTHLGVQQSSSTMLCTGPIGHSVVIDPKEFPEMEKFQVIIVTER